MNGIDQLIRALESAGAESEPLQDPRTAHVLADGRRLLGSRSIPGVDIAASETGDEISVRIAIAERAAVRNPIHLCVGMLETGGTQKVRLEIDVGTGAEAEFLAHCLFPNVETALHQMNAAITLGEGSSVKLYEEHYHGRSGGMKVLPTARVTVGPGARYCADFVLVKGRVGRLEIDNAVEIHPGGAGELRTRVFGHETDYIRLHDEVSLIGEGARGLVKSRVALEGSSTAEILGIIDGRARDARGHMDCWEIVRDHAKAESTPIVRVSHPEAKVTHEAAIGSIDRDQLETLMARGLKPEQAIDTVVRGMLAG
jgi:Fe-S cluster assembly scaffold protein SufB